MVVKRTCSFCAGEIEPGTGSMFVKRDGTVFHFCSSSCRKQQLHLGRVGHRFKWTRAYELKRTADRASIARAPRADRPAPAPAAARPPKTEVSPEPAAEAPVPAEAAAPAPAKRAPKARTKTTGAPRRAKAAKPAADAPPSP
jgi:large subunit ribosomal protein L24e